MKKLQKFLLLAALITLGSCAMEIGPEEKTIIPPGGEEPVDTELTVLLPGGFATLTTRALTQEQENVVNDVLVYVFDSSYVLQEVVEGEGITNSTSRVDGMSSEAKFTATLPRGKHNIVIAANTGESASGTSLQGKSRAEVVTMLSYEFDAARLASFATDGIPMWGEASVSVGTVNLDPISLVRAVARIDIGVGQWNATTETWNGNDAEGRRIPFNLTEVYVMRPSDAYRVVPDKAEFNAGEPSREADFGQYTSEQSEQMFKYTTETSSLRNEIYVPEAEVIMEGTPGDGNHLERMALVVGGSFSGGETSYYRLDFADDGALMDVLRNKLYRFDISSVTGKGATSVEAAYESTGGAMEAKLLEWDEQPVTHIIRVGDKYLGMSDIEVELSPLAEETFDVRVLTNLDSFTLTAGGMTLSSATPGSVDDGKIKYTLTKAASPDEWTLEIETLTQNWGPGGADIVHNWTIVAGDLITMELDVKQLWSATNPNDGAITVESTVGGTAMADHETAPEGTVVKVQAAASVDNMFIGWEVVSGPAGFELSDAEREINPLIFSMPAGGVTLRARFLGPYPYLDGPAAPFILYFDDKSQTLQVGKWGDKVTSIAQMPYFKFGSVVAIKGEGNWVDGESLISFNPSNKTITNYASIPVYETADYDRDLHNTSDAAYHNAANIALGKGDPCKLVGLTVDQIKSGIIDNGRFRMPTVYDNVNFVGGPDVKHPQTKDGLFWKEWQIGGLNYNYKEDDSDWSGDTNTYPLGVTPNDTEKFDYWAPDGGTPISPGTAGFPLVAQGSVATKTHILPAAGLRIINGSIDRYGTRGLFFSSTPYNNVGNYYLNFTMNGVSPAYYSDHYTYAFSVRCVEVETNQITVTAGAGGSAIADHQEAGSGTAIKLQASPDNGMLFAGWEIVSGGPLADLEVTKNPATFTMPAGAVTIRAKFVNGTPTAPYILYYEPTSKTLRLGTWGEQITSLAQMSYFKFGSVVAIKSSNGGTPWVDDGSKVSFNPSGKTITTWESVPMYEATDYAAQKNISAPSYHNAANIALGKGDPCKLVGLTVEQIKAGVIDNGQWRLPTVYENVNFVGGPAEPYPHQRQGTFWKTFDHLSMTSRYAYGLSDSWEGSAIAASTVLAEATYTQSVVVAGKNFVNPNQIKLPLETTDYAEARAYTLPASGYHSASGLFSTPGHYGGYWSSTPTIQEGRAHHILFGTDTGLYPVDDREMANGFAIRCVPAEVQAFGVTVTAGTGGSAIANVQTAAAGDAVTIQASPSVGMAFAGWEVVSGGAGSPMTLSGLDPRANPATFNMSNGPVEVRAKFIDVTPTAPYILYYEPTSKTLRLGTWGEQITSIAQMPYFKFGSVVGIKSEGAWMDDGSLVNFNPSNKAVTTWASVPVYEAANFEKNLRNISDPAYHNAVNIALGKGDPCKLVGLTVEQIKAGVIDNGQWRLPTVYENINFVGGPDVKHPQTKPGYFWKEWQVGGANYNYKEDDSTWAGDVNTYPLGVEPNNTATFDWWVHNGGNLANPGTSSFPVVAQGSTPKGYYTLPAAGARIPTSGATTTHGTHGHFWASTPQTAANGYYLLSHINATLPASRTVYAYGLSVRCVPQTKEVGGDLAVVVEATDGGAAIADTKTARPGQTVKVTAQASSGYVFIGWQITGTVPVGFALTTEQVNARTMSFTMPAGDVSLRARFASSAPAAPYILYWDQDSKMLRVGAWNAVNSAGAVTQNNVMFTHFGGVIGFTSDSSEAGGGAWDSSKIKFNPTNLPSSTWNAQRVSESPTGEAFETIPNWLNWSGMDPTETRDGFTSSSEYHYAANVRDGRGDPCKLVGLTMEQIKAGAVDNGQWRLATRQEWIDAGYAVVGTMPASVTQTTTFGIQTSAGASSFVPATGVRWPVHGGAADNGRSVSHWTGQPVIYNSAEGPLPYGYNVHVHTGSPGQVSLRNTSPPAEGKAIRCVGVTGYNVSATATTGGAANVSVPTARAGDPVTFTSTTAPADKIFGGWEVVTGPAGFALPDNNNPMTIAMPAGNLQLRATYVDKEVTIMMSDGPVTWAGSNLIANGVFAPNATDHGTLFLWGTNVPIGIDEVVEPWPSDYATSDKWVEGARGPADPCPVGWRVPTLRETVDLLGIKKILTPEESATAQGQRPGVGSRSGPYTMFTWSDGVGLRLTPKAGDTGKTLVMPNGGYIDWKGMVYPQTQTFNYWSTPLHENGKEAYSYYFHSREGYTNGYAGWSEARQALSVRCVKVTPPPAPGAARQEAANSYMINPTSVPAGFSIPISQARAGWEYVAANGGTAADLTNFDNIINSGGWRVETLWKTWPGATNVTGRAARVNPDSGDWYANLTIPAGIPLGSSAVVALKSGTTVLWSWHLWFTDYAPNAPEGSKRGQTHTYFGDAFGPSGIYKDRQMMDRNLGAMITGVVDAMGIDPSRITVADGYKYYGFAYQWGRKDPFTLSGTTLNEPLRVYNAAGAARSDDEAYPKVAGGTADNRKAAIQNPTAMYNSTAALGWDWTAPKDDNLWGNTTNVKSPFDPCPAGWQVPVGGSVLANPWTGFYDNNPSSTLTGGTTTPGAGVFTEVSTSGSANYGRLYDKGGDKAWYPANGLRPGLIAGISGTLHVASVNLNVPANGNSMSFNSTGVHPFNNGGRVNGFSVRCVSQGNTKTMRTATATAATGGTATVDRASAPTGAHVKFTATVPANSVFDHWEVVSGGPAIGFDLVSNPTSGPMPAANLTLRAVFATASATPPYEVRVNNTIWAGANLVDVDGDGVSDGFASTDTAYGSLFQWGFKDAIANDGVLTMPHARDERKGVAVWPEAENPCPAGWRIPNVSDIVDLLGIDDMALLGTAAVWGTNNPTDPLDNPDGKQTYSVDGYTTISFTPTENITEGAPTDSPTDGAIIVSKTDGKTLFLPNAGRRAHYLTPAGSPINRGTGTFFWSSEESPVVRATEDPQALRGCFNWDAESGNLSHNGKAYAMSVRCVKSASTTPLTPGAARQEPANSYMINPTSIPAGFSIPISQARAGWEYVAANGGTPADLTDFDAAINSGDWRIETLWKTWPGGNSITGRPARTAPTSGDWYANLTIPAGIPLGSSAVVVLKSVSGTVLWSWHLWFTDYAPNAPEGSKHGQTHTYFSDAFGPSGIYRDRQMMDRNLGATITGVTDSYVFTTPPTLPAEFAKYFGLTYQWGRKDPITSYDGTDVSKVYNAAGVVMTDNEAFPRVNAVQAQNNLGTSVKEPTKFFIGTEETEFDWAVPRNSDLWGNDTGVKSVFDPCPAGWQIPKGGKLATNNPWAGFGDGDPSSVAGNVANTDSSAIFRYFGGAVTMRGYLYHNGGDAAWYPLDGYRAGNTGDYMPSNTGVAGTIPTEDFPGHISLGRFGMSQNRFDPSTATRRSTSSSVRCVSQGNTKTMRTATAVAATGGTATVDRGSAPSGAHVKFTATPAADYVFAGWEVASGVVRLTPTQVGSNPLSLPMPAANVTLRATFTLPTPDMVLYLDGGGRLQARKFDNSTVKISNIPYFKFGSVVGIKSEGTWADGTSLVPFNPSNATISTWASIPVYNNNSTDFANFKNISDPAYTNVANIRLGKGDPCMLIGYSAAEIKAMSDAQIQTVLDNATLRLPTVMENVNFVGGPADPYPNQRAKTFWKTYDPGSAATYYSYSYRTNEAWAGDDTTASTDVAEATYTQSLERKGSSLADPDLVKFPVETTDYADARTFTLPATGRRDTSGVPDYQGMYGHFWSSTPLYSSGNGHYLYFGSPRGIWPAIHYGYDGGLSVRCVSSSGVEARAMAVDNYGVDSNPGGTVQVAGGSSGNTSSARIKSGTEVTFRATPAAGHGFHAWSASGITLTDKQRITSPLTITMPANEVSLTAGFDHTPDYVPVPSGTTEMIVDDIIWASANVDDAGVFVQSNSGDAKYGKYFQWGRTVGYSYNHGSALPASGTDQTGNTVWPEAKDPCPTGWRIPTTAEWNAMITSSSPKPSVPGDMTFQMAAPNSGSMFLPTAGAVNTAGTPNGRGSASAYWTNSQAGSTTTSAYTFRDAITVTNSAYKTDGVPIRCVREEGNNSALTTRSAKVTAGANGTVNMSGWGDVYSTSSQTTSTIGGVGVTFRAKANNGYIFTGWTASGVTLTNAQKKTNPLTITMPAANVTLTATFAPITPDMVLYLDGAGKLQAGKFDNSTVKVSNMLYFKFGSVVGIKSEGAWVNGTSLIPFNPSNATISTWASIPVYNTNPTTDFANFKDVSASGYTSVANIRAGKGDPCTLVGYTAAELKAMSDAQLQTVLNNAALRLPTVMENVQFVGGPASEYANQRPNTSWKNFNPASGTYVNYNYRINEAWAGDSTTASTVVAEATYTQSLEIRGSSLADPNLVKLPVETTDYATARAYTLPAAGLRNTAGAPDVQGTRAYFWASTPYHSSGNGHNLYFYSARGIWPAYNNSYAYGFSVRCVAR